MFERKGEKQNLISSTIFLLMNCFYLLGNLVNLSEIKKLQDNILGWYATNKRLLPRRETDNPYAIHISEVMSQQTQVDRVIPYWKTWMKDIPDYKALAWISKIDLLSHWSWLGFNSRALRLQECAREVMEKYDWILPRDKEKLLELPWIGPYTASAICAFARNLAEPVIDTNIRRVLIFLLKLPEDISYSELENIAKELIPSWRSRDWHNALMDYWATHLTARKTKIKSLWKQSKFEWSDREVRWWILKQLTASKWALKISKIHEEFPRKDIDVIIDWMVKDRMIQRVWDYVIIE